MEIFERRSSLTVGFNVQTSEAYWRPCKTFMMEFFAINLRTKSVWLSKQKDSIVDVWQGPYYAAGFTKCNQR